MISHNRIHPELDDILIFETLDSTNQEAYRRRSEFVGHNILFISNEQTLGKGQYGRHWESEAGLGLWMSLLLGSPTVLKHDLQLLSLYVGIVICRSLTTLMDVDISLKWPNDIIIGNRKCGGVLTEVQWAGATAVSATIGIGINLEHRLTDFSVSIQQTATSLHLAGWEKPDREQVLKNIVQVFFNNIDLLDRAADLAKEWNKVAFKINEPIQWSYNNTIQEGQFLGITETGEAQILRGGVIHNFRSGEIQLNLSV
ncbi:MAG: biotin--[acetyl-CoA-carboxylase] ligase [Candidatus Marinimicrobia bacterium]|nr:biotin--[acetyl-CoA-carboxylase] ligase [Candidatus Neomarinimicrobiota bacterium]